MWEESAPSAQTFSKATQLTLIFFQDLINFECALVSCLF